jgi:hypothetical protein
MNLVRTIRLFLLLEALSFFTAALVHFGIIAQGFEHQKAGTAETVIGSVLALSLIFGLLRPTAARTAALAAQGFALLGTFVGLFTIAIGVGPRTAPDLTYHFAIVAVLIWGLMMTARSGRRRETLSGDVFPTARILR